MYRAAKTVEERRDSERDAKEKSIKTAMSIGKRTFRLN